MGSVAKSSVAAGVRHPCLTHASHRCALSRPTVIARTWAQRSPVRSPRTVVTAKESEELDPIERFVERFFGRKALEDRNPAGMKRLDEDAAPEMYPATTTEFAEPVEGDDVEMLRIRPLLARTQLECRPLRLAYDAAVHGWSPEAFHARVDSFGAAVVLAETEGGTVCGGYNPRGWIGLGEDRDSIAAFLFTWPTGDLTQRAVKLPKVGGPSLAVTKDAPGEGPQFGAEGLTIRMERGQERVARSRLGTFYTRMPDGGRSLFAAGDDPKRTTLRSLRVYVAEGDGERWELDGIVWKTSG